jgi:hypothetical protein
MQMKKEDLLKTAQKLAQPSPEALTEFSEKAENMANELNQRFSKRSDLQQLIGEGNTEMMFDNHRNHLRFMISLFSNYEPQVLVETVLWVFRAYRSHGFSLTYWPAQLDNWVDTFKNHLSKSCIEEIYPFYNWMIVNNPYFALLSDEAIIDDAHFKIQKHE